MNIQHEILAWSLKGIKVTLTKIEISEDDWCDGEDWPEGSSPGDIVWECSFQYDCENGFETAVRTAWTKEQAYNLALECHEEDVKFDEWMAKMINP